jgi:glycosyltransferase involved in cell wall biosynthesis
MKISVIISTYNNPKWLEKSLWGYLNQQRKADEIVIADDGSGEETRALIERYKKVLPIVHVWHEDDGFRKTIILNKALLASTGDYLVLTDHDCIPRADFLRVHEQKARKGCFLSGGYLKLPMPLSQQLSFESVQSQEAFSLKWLLAHGMKKTFKCSKLIKNQAFTKFMNYITPTHATWNGMNSSGWREDILRARGFDERMRYGGLDRELGERLMNAGIKPLQIRYSAIVLHLDHKRPYVNREDLANNLQIRKETKQKHLTETPYGITNNTL